MSKFWVSVGALVLLGVALTAFAKSDQGITFTDLETECRYDRTGTGDFSLQDDRIHFEGMLPVQNTDAKVRYDYSRSAGKIVLNMKAEKLDAPESFVDSCLGVGIYDGYTSELSPGLYDVRLKHRGKLLKRQVIRVK
ncbi:MAG: hypothetical protein ABEJ91_01770 [Candidatus Nanohaloarchaea archaeon]